MSEAVQVTASVPPNGEAAKGLSSSRSAASAPLMEFVSFAIGEHQYGVPITSVREIKGWSGATHLPHQLEYVRGVMSLRGSMVPVVDLRSRFEQGETDATPLHIVIIVQIAGRLVGLLADRVLDIVSIEQSNIQPVPRSGKSISADFLAGLVAVDDDELLALIDLQALLSIEEEDDPLTSSELASLLSETVKGEMGPLTDTR